MKKQHGNLSLRKKGQTRKRIVVTKDFKMFAISRGSAISSHNPIKWLVTAPESRQPDPHHHFGFNILWMNSKSDSASY